MDEISCEELKEEISCKELKDEIDFWEKEIQSYQMNNYLYEIAFFKIFIKLEKYLAEMFLIYSTGKSSSKGYTAKRQLKFENEAHLRNIFMNPNRKYMDYTRIIQERSKYIFEKNPFEIVFFDASLSGCFKQMTILRNYIAHESIEAKDKYISKVLNNKDFIRPSEYLYNKNKLEPCTNFGYFIKKIKEITMILSNPDLFDKSLTN